MCDSAEQKASGKIYFVGIGPGDPELMTIKAYKVLKSADVIIYTGSLINREILKLFPDAEKIDSYGLTTERIVEIMKERFLKGKTVVRVHDGDPSIFGATKEQYELLKKDGIDFEVIPGVSSFLAAASALKIEYTVPEITQTIVITRYPKNTPVPEDIKELMKQKPTLIFFLSAKLLDEVIRDLVDSGFPLDFPCAVCYKISWRDEKVILGTLSEISEKVKKEGIRSHALFIVSKAFLAEGKRSFLYSDQYLKTAMKKKKEIGSDFQIITSTRETSHIRHDQSYDNRGRQTESAYSSEKSRLNNLQNDDKLPQFEQSEETTLRSFKKGVVIFSITRGGVDVALRLAKRLGTETTVFIPQRFSKELKELSEEVVFFEKISDALSESFRRYSGIIWIGALGILVRLIAKSINDKAADPAVLCVDEKGKNVISVLSGHLGGANELARVVARHLSATPIITTASDVLGTIPVDILGKNFGWNMKADQKTITKVSSAIVNYEKVAVVQECGEMIFFPEGNIFYFVDLFDFLKKQEDFSACLFISYRTVPKDVFRIPVVFYHPKVLHVGVGFDKGVKGDELYLFLKETFSKFSLALESIKRVATVDVKRDDEEFRKFASTVEKEFDAEVVFFPAEKLNEIEVSNPSDVVRRYLGTSSVAEASALMSAGGGKLVVSKQKGLSYHTNLNITLAVALES